MRSSTPSEGQHGLPAKTLHWGTAGLIAYGYLSGVEDVSELSDPTRFRSELFFAGLLGVLLLARFLWMHLINGHTGLPRQAPTWERALSRCAHLGMYFGLAMVIASGLAIALGVASPVLGAGFVSVMIGLHEASLDMTALLITVHILGALWHLLVRRDGVWGSLMPALGPNTHLIEKED